CLKSSNNAIAARSWGLLSAHPQVTPSPFASTNLTSVAQESHSNIVMLLALPGELAEQFSTGTFGNGCRLFYRVEISVVVLFAAFAQTDLPRAVIFVHIPNTALTCDIGAVPIHVVLRLVGD